MSFAHVYRVTTLNQLVSGVAVDSLERDLQFPLPLGYREYLTTLGYGELCDLLQVRPPEVVKEHLEQKAWELESIVNGSRDGWWKPSVLTPEDLEGAVTIADTAEGDLFIVCPRLAPRLFELPRHSDVIREHQNGFWDVVESSVREMGHDFPFFVPFDDGRRRRCVLDVSAALGMDGLIKAVADRWGAGNLIGSRVRQKECKGYLFVRPIHACLVCHGEVAWLDQDRVAVVMDYDLDAEEEVGALVQTIGIRRPKKESQ